MAKKSKRTKSKKHSPSKIHIAEFLAAPSLEAEPVDHIAFHIMLQYVNGTGFTDIRQVVENSYRMADQFLKTLNERHHTTT